MVCFRWYGKKDKTEYIDIATDFFPNESSISGKLHRKLVTLVTSREVYRMTGEWVRRETFFGKILGTF